MPAAMSQTETPTRAGASGPPVMEASPDSACTSMFVGLAVGVGAVLAVAGDGADHEARMRAPQRVERKAELGDGAGLEVLHEHVGLGEHRREQRLVVGAREIEHYRFLAAVEPDEIRALSVLFPSACSVRSLSPRSVCS